MNLFDSTKASIVPEEVQTYKDLGGVYIYMLEGMKHKFKELFDIFIKYPYETVLFHCSAGKDRTGVTAALLLDLIGCHEYDIVKDYSESYENNLEINASLAQMMDNEEAKQYLKSSPRYMMELLDYLREHYGSAKEYLLEIGMKNEEIDQIIENFTI
ncbi:tyrosine-protein phosphatase [Allocoprobacillus halotolerans]|uniref:Tyrosine-protein phosphatase n=1 Tax=Allocoprobacillus halotolerans TaxID=2944914 RepID=A0ABY5I1V7_9FIRM|nr:tyrosine-protein phosphatase [Allocoprobacillus halotolerans]UTY39309.1 tyrosine-protein phosphatase [Allocoprobacillus halotolerans]